MADITHAQVVQARREYMAGAEQRAKDEAARREVVAARQREEAERNKTAWAELALETLLRHGASDYNGDVHFTSNLMCSDDDASDIKDRLEKAGFTLVPPPPSSDGIYFWVNHASKHVSTVSTRHGYFNITVKNTWATSQANVKTE